jgi:choline dehydrogenase
VTEFDFIVCCAGSAGRVLANCLTASGRHTVLDARPCKPTSLGELQLAGIDPMQAPRSLDTEPGRQDMLEATLFLRRLAATPALSTVIESELVPGTQTQSHTQLTESIRQCASTVFHPVATCRTGPSPEDAVVDVQLRVHGLQGLRVIEASVFSPLTSGNTNAPTLMLAERAATAVLAAHEEPSLQ